MIRITPGIETSSGRKKKCRSSGKNCGGARESAGRWQRSGDMSYDVTVCDNHVLLLAPLLYQTDKMNSIHRTNDVLEKGIELWIAENVRRTGISASWLVDEVRVEGFG